MGGSVGAFAPAVPLSVTAETEWPACRALGRSGLDVAEVDGFEAEGMGDVAGL